MVHRPYTGFIDHQTHMEYEPRPTLGIYTSSSLGDSNTLGAKLGNATLACVKPSELS